MDDFYDALDRFKWICLTFSIAFTEPTKLALGNSVASDWASRLRAGWQKRMAAPSKFRVPSPRGQYSGFEFPFLTFGACARVKALTGAFRFLWHAGNRLGEENIAERAEETSEQ
jgi:hypothetical protein